MLEVRVRHVEETNAVPFCKCPFGKQYDIIRDIESNGGVVLDGNPQPFHSHQYVMDNGVIYFEIIVGEEEE